ncbi:MAG: hypothetical protein IT453_04885 [Planctomycetes bacterium]|nr:hypothetical protein [Planctomycetota bacterium]
MKKLGLAGWVLALLLASAAGPGDDGRLAPDGKRGFGGGHPLGDLLHVVRQPDDADRRWLASLAALPGEIDTFAVLARDRYQKRGYFALLDEHADPELAALHAAFRAAEADAVATLQRQDARAQAFARMYFDLRFLLRAEVLDGYADERAELARSLAVLRAATDGHVQLSEPEARTLASRADLAASFLRAIRADLESLHVVKPEKDVETDTFVKADALVALAVARDKDREQAFELAARIDELGKHKQRMIEALGVSRLRARLAEALAARSKALAEGAKLGEQAALYFEEPNDGSPPPADIAKLSRSDRMRIARELATRALAKDPLHEQSVWILAKCVDFFDGEVFSRQHFDRYLALRGIRAHLWETIRDRKLDRREQEALDVVQRSSAPPVR